MFFCCCPGQQAEPDQSEHLAESLIERESKPAPITTSNASPIIQNSSEPIKRQVPLNKNLEKMSEDIATYISPISNTNSNPRIAAAPADETSSAEIKNMSKSISKVKSADQAEKVRKKSDIWDEQAGTKILYFVSEKEEEMIFVFKIVGVKATEGSPLAYLLHPHRNTHKIRTKPVEASLNFVVWSKSIAETKSAVKGLDCDGYVRTIFGVCKKEEEQKGKAVYETEDIAEIITMGCNCVRLDIFDRIVLWCLNQKDFKQILSFCQRITENFELDDLSRVIFLFPQDLTLSEINLLLSKVGRKHLVSKRLENIAKYLGYHVQLVDSDVFQPVLVVKSNLLMCEQEEVFGREFQVRLELAIGLLMIEINYSNFKLYEKVLDSFFVDMTIAKYLRLVQFVHREKKDYLTKLQELQLFENAQIAQIQNSNKIEERVINPCEKCVIIKYKTKKRMGELFADYRSAQTPIQESQKKKKEWDDDLRENDIRVTQLDKNQEEQLEDNCNIFESIDDSYVDNASLDIIASLDFKQDD